MAFKNWWVKELTEDCVDNYGHHVAAGFRMIKGRYIEGASEKSYSINYHILKKNVYVLKESVLYPFVNFDITKTFYFIRNNDYCGILSHVEHFRVSALKLLKSVKTCG